LKKTIFLLALIIGFVSCKDKPRKDNLAPVAKKEKTEIRQYGFRMDEYKIIRDTIAPGESFGTIMAGYGIGPGKVYDITQGIMETFDPRNLIAGKPYAILKPKDSLEQVKAFVYENSRTDYTVVSIDENVAYQGQKPVTIRRKTASGTINSSLSEAVDNVLLSYKLAKIYQWKIDFFRLQKGDNFKLIYDVKYINDSIYAGIENIEAAVFKHKDETFYAFHYEGDSIERRSDYYNEKGEALESFFLKAPLDFTRISSRYQKRRFHPVLKTYRSHLGTDYAAPHGTPIWSTADGTVIVSGYTSGNGKYVKIRHNSTYTTQYLHMSRRAVSRGEYVKQGDIIGYVGSTGLATGPHVCYRFWVNGRQVDPYRQDLPDSKPLPEELIPHFTKTVVTPLKAELDSIELEELPLL
jgi:murein DD-endopeptidase MepM/ murein hydrolase activator NlpD